MTVIDGWYSAALVIKYTVGGFRHFLFFQKCAVRFLKKVMYIDRLRDISSLVASLKETLYCILVGSATRPKMTLTSRSGRTKIFECFHWPIENECPVEMNMKEKLYVLHFTSGPKGGTLRKSSVTNGDHSRSIPRNRLSFRVTKAVHRLQLCHS